MEKSANGFRLRPDGTIDEFPVVQTATMPMDGGRIALGVRHATHPDALHRAHQGDQSGLPTLQVSLDENQARQLVEQLQRALRFQQENQKPDVRH